MLCIFLLKASHDVSCKRNWGVWVFSVRFYIYLARSQALFTVVAVVSEDTSGVLVFLIPWISLETPYMISEMFGSFSCMSIIFQELHWRVVGVRGWELFWILMIRSHSLSVGCDLPNCFSALFYCSLRWIRKPEAAGIGYFPSPLGRLEGARIVFFPSHGLVRLW